MTLKLPAERGASVADTVAAALPIRTDHDRIRVHVGDVPVPRSLWVAVKPRAGTIITIETELAR